MALFILFFFILFSEVMPSWNSETFGGAFAGQGMKKKTLHIAEAKPGSWQGV